MAVAGGTEVPPPARPAVQADAEGRGARSALRSRRPLSPRPPRRWRRSPRRRGGGAISTLREPESRRGGRGRLVPEAPGSGAGSLGRRPPPPRTWTATDVLAADMEAAESATAAVSALPPTFPGRDSAASPAVRRGGGRRHQLGRRMFLGRSFRHTGACHCLFGANRIFYNFFFVICVPIGVFFFLNRVLSRALYCPNMRV